MQQINWHGQLLLCHKKHSISRHIEIVTFFGLWQSLLKDKYGVNNNKKKNYILTFLLTFLPVIFFINLPYFPCLCSFPLPFLSLRTKQSHDRWLLGSRSSWCRERWLQCTALPFQCWSTGLGKGWERLALVFHGVLSQLTGPGIWMDYDIIVGILPEPVQALWHQPTGCFSLSPDCGSQESTSKCISLTQALAIILFLSPPVSKLCCFLNLSFYVEHMSSKFLSWP